ncbi:LacI family DNA-binding transcriptional regulator [Paracoccus gahaiensis]|uniref:LacI family DNA-binding transcriptional regulator n=1 Tax=Paracoccus gahaiensis TaxID=1706839 RepID=A0A4U0R639_9RHOB|nr:PfkB family carbohydrate kinase [Paracoccus gahaiensis]TJZ90176.1 LacI family DNA-binding transcriptional regulator [Paracoccus gahaiensis]
MVNAGTGKHRRRATIREVAQLAGVSVGTVSHVLTSSKAVSESSRAAVLKAVEKLNYQPNSLARSLIARRSRVQREDQTERPRLVTVGYLSIDYMVHLDHAPQSGDRVTSKSIEKMLGGPAANVAAFAAGLGKPFELNVEIVTHFGSDADSLWALEELERQKIDTSSARQQPNERLSRCIVLVEGDGQRTIINEPLTVPVEFLARHLEGRVTGLAPVCVHFDGFHKDVAFRVKNALQAEGYLLSIHAAGLPASSQSIEGAAELIQSFDLVFLDSRCFSQICATSPELSQQPEHIFNSASSPRCRAVIVTRGAKGAMLLRPGHAPLILHAQATKVIDATGAGDAFVGLFLGSWLAQDDLEAALGHAVRGASLSLMALGAQGRLAVAADVMTPFERGMAGTASRD